MDKIKSVDERQEGGGRLPDVFYLRGGYRGGNRGSLFDSTQNFIIFRPGGHGVITSWCQ